MATKPQSEEIWEERRRLEGQPEHIAAAAADSQRQKQRLDKETRGLAKELERARYRLVTEGPSESVTLEMAKLDARLVTVPGEQQRIAAMLEATTQAQRRHRVDLDQHLKSEMPTFRAEAERLSEVAEARLRALVAAFREAQREWEAAASEWAILARPLAELLRERDEAGGVHRQPSYYAAACAPPRFPLSPTVLVAKSKPAAVDLLKGAAKPGKRPLMRRVA